MNLPNLARDTLPRHSNVTFIEGKKGEGKTNFRL
jgi:recombinational DNA repair ATPase RecF